MDSILFHESFPWFKWATYMPHFLFFSNVQEGSNVFLFSMIILIDKYDQFNMIEGSDSDKAFPAKKFKKNFVIS